MTYAIIGSGNVGAALARIFARENINVLIANSRGPESLVLFAKELGPSVTPTVLQDVLSADVIFLAVPFAAYKAVAAQFDNRNGKLLIDATNAFNVSSEDLGGRLSSEVVADAFAGARLVKGFNHLPAKQLGASPRQAIFLSSNDVESSAVVADLAGQLGFAPIELGRLDQGGVPLHVVNGRPGGLLLKNLAEI